MTTENEIQQVTETGDESVVTKDVGTVDPREALVSEAAALMQDNAAQIDNACITLLERFQENPTLHESWLTQVSGAVNIFREALQNVVSKSEVDVAEVDAKNREAFEKSDMYQFVLRMATRNKQVTKDGKLKKDDYEDLYSEFTKPFSPDEVGVLTFKVKADFHIGKTVRAPRGEGAMAVRTRDNLTGKECATYDCYLYGWRKSHPSLVSQLPEELQSGNYNQSGGKTFKWLEEHGQLSQGINDGKSRGYLQAWAEQQEVNGEPRFQGV